jgi:Flp pilus assembly protein TadD
VEVYEPESVLRVRIAGYRLLWARDVFIHHAGHQTFRDGSEEAYRRRFTENERLFREKWDVARHLQPWVEETRLVGRLQGGGAGPWDLLRAGRYPEAYDAFEELLRVEPPDVRAFLGLGLAAEGRGVPAAAALAYRAALSIAPDDPDAVRGIARVSGPDRKNGGNSA